MTLPFTSRLLRDRQPLRFPIVPYAKKIVLHTPKGYGVALDALVALFIKDGVTFVGVVGKDCSKIEAIIDELCVGDGSNAYDILTSSHPEESLEQAIVFARSLTGEFSGEIEAHRVGLRQRSIAFDCRHGLAGVPGRSARCKIGKAHLQF
jgi:hypothetical protein